MEKLPILLVDLTESKFFVLYQLFKDFNAKHIIQINNTNTSVKKNMSGLHTFTHKLL